MGQYYFTNAYPLANNQNIDFTGDKYNNPYLLAQQAGKSRRKHKHKRSLKRKKKTHKRKRKQKN